jgi:hypothetical protein
VIAGKPESGKPANRRLIRRFRGVSRAIFQELWRRRRVFSVSRVEARRATMMAPKSRSSPGPSFETKRDYERARSNRIERTRVAYDDFASSSASFHFDMLSEMIRVDVKAA